MKTNLNDLICFNYYKGWRSVTAIHKQIYGNDNSIQMHFLLKLCDLTTTTNISDIAKGMNLDNSAVSLLVSRMEKKGLLRREDGEADRRIVFVKLTNAGRDLRAFYSKKVELFNQAITKGMSPTDQATLQSIVVKIERNRENRKKEF